MGCGQKREVPAGVLPRVQMQAVLWDLMRADQFLMDYVFRKDSALDKLTESQRYYQYIFAQHKISKEQFEKSFSWYQDHPTIFRALLDSIAAAPKEPIPVPVNTADTAVTTPLVSDSAMAVPAPATPATDTAQPRRRVKKVSGN